MGIDLPGINRNIVECKEDCRICVWKWRLGINRNIVECKERYVLYNRFSCSVLIETLWNVKENF